MRQGRGKVTKAEQGGAQGPMRRHVHSRVVPFVCQREELLGERMGRLVLGPHEVKIP
jgi:hypothetical protein